MTLWTTFCPSKICWELTAIETTGKSPRSDWQKHQSLIAESLNTIKTAGISGIRLVIFPSELTTDGKIFDWKPIEIMLTLCRESHLLVDLCIGPFQYPYYPGIYLPKELTKQISPSEKYLDTDLFLESYGIDFLERQMNRHGNDKRIRGFHLANEWPDKQGIAGREEIKLTVSHEFMIATASYLKKATTKPILLNTNIDASDKKKMENVFGKITQLLGKQGHIGFDIYPSQEVWKKVPLQKIRRVFESYSKSFAIICSSLSPSEIYFAEVEAQPWGNGNSWFHLIKNEIDPQEKVLTYSRTSLPNTWRKYIQQTNCQSVSLWGADFWLSAEKMGITWPLEQLKSCIETK